MGWMRRASPTLFAWTAAEFDTRMRGSAIYRIGFERWSRNIAVALGNAPTSEEVVSALEARRADASALVREHVEWALGSRHPAPQLRLPDLNVVDQPRLAQARRREHDQVLGVRSWRAADPAPCEPQSNQAS